MNRKTAVYFVGIATVISSLFLWLACQKHVTSLSSGIYTYLGGPVGAAYSPVEIMFWLIIFTPVWAVCGCILEAERRVAELSISRFGHLYRWWLRLLLKLGGFNLWYFVLFGLLLKLRRGCFVDGRILRVLVTMGMHSLAMTAIMVWVYILTKRTILAIVIPLAAEILAKLPVLAGAEPWSDPFVFGMYGYSREVYGAGGFSWSTAMVIQGICILSIAILPLCMKSLIIRSVKFDGE